MEDFLLSVLSVDPIKMLSRKVSRCARRLVHRTNLRVKCHIFLSIIKILVAPTNPSSASTRRVGRVGQLGLFFETSSLTSLVAYKLRSARLFKSVQIKLDENFCLVKFRTSSSRPISLRRTQDSNWSTTPSALIVLRRQLLLRRANTRHDAFERTI